MSSKRKGNLNITESTSMSPVCASGASNQSNLGQLENDNISDDDSHEDETPSDGIEINKVGIEAVKICHFCADDLKNLGLYYNATVVKEPPEGMVTKVTIKGAKKYAEDIERKVHGMKESLKSLLEEKIQLDVTKASEVKEIAKKHADDSQLLVHISPLERVIYVLAKDSSKHGSVLHQIKVCLGLIKPSSRGDRSLEGTGSEEPKGRLYPDLSKVDTDSSEENRDYSGKGDRRDDRGSSYDTGRQGDNYTKYTGRDKRDGPSNETRDRYGKYDSRENRGQPDRNKKEIYSGKTGQQEDRGYDRGDYKGYGKPRHDVDRHRYQGNQDYDNRKNKNYGDEDFSVEYRFDSGFVLKVYKASITRLNVDAIVNAANDNLMHGGGVAKVISDAAGYQLDRESRDYVKKKGLIRVGDNCLTSAGKLPYDAVIHAVGPQWHDYRDKKDCLEDLHKTVINILKTSDREKYREVAMSAISAGVFAVPKELCADMYIQAVSDFSAMGMRYPRELHIIDVDVSILKLVEISYNKWKKDPTSVQAKVTLKQYLKDHPTYQYSRDDEWKNQGKGQRKGRQFNRQWSDPDKGNFDSGTSKELDRAVVKGVGSEPLRWGGRSSIYNINDSVKVHVYTGKIEKVEDVDAVICGTDTTFGTSSYIARAFLQEFGDKYKRNFDKMKSKAGYLATNSYVYVCESGSRKATNVMHLAMKPVMYGDELQDYKKGLSNIFHRAEKWKFAKIALPLLGTGLIQTKQDLLKACCRCVLQALSDFCSHGNKYLMEVHLVNNKEDASKMMKDIFEEAEKSSVKSDTYGQTTGNHDLSPGNRSYRRSFSSNYEEEECSKRLSDSFNSSRTYGSRNSEGEIEVDGFDKLAVSRRDAADDDRMSGPRSGPDPVSSHTAVSGNQAQSEVVKSDVKKKKGNLRIILQD